jgi:hypothetical protein
MVRGVMLLSVCFVALAASPPAARAQSQQQGTVEISVKSIVDKLGLKPSGNVPDEFELGRSITVSLADPAKIAKYGIVGMHEGARVTMTRVAPDRIRVEADEMEPVPNKSIVTLKVAANGSMTQAPPPERPKPPGA